MARRFTPRLERAPLPLILTVVPIASVMLASLLILVVPMVATYPLVPPFGLLALISWRLLVRDIWPAWMALPLGLFDDMCSGQPLGSSACSWTVILLIMELVDRRMMWRDYRKDWQIGIALIGFGLVAALFFANVTGGSAPVWILFPQFLISSLVLPLVMRCVARLDRFRWRS